MTTNNEEEIKKADEKLLQLLISRISSRESASLAFVTISSSASLVFLGFAFDKISQFLFIPIIGIIFPALGLIYFELTSRTIHSHDHDQIRELILKNLPDGKDKDRIEKIILFNKRRTERGLVSRFLLFTPIIAWLSITSIISSNEISKCLAIVGIIISAIAIGWLTKTDNLRDKDKCKNE